MNNDDFKKLRSELLQELDKFDYYLDSLHLQKKKIIKLLNSKEIKQLLKGGKNEC